MKRRTNAQKKQDYFDVFKCIREGNKVKRSGTKDGSIATHPTVEVRDMPEKDVVKQCISWLRKFGIFCNRHDTGVLSNDRGQYRSYGIRNGGDIIGLTPSGKHFEIECKKGSGGRFSFGQQKRQRDILRNNGIYLIIHGVAELEHYEKLFK